MRVRTAKDADMPERLPPTPPSPISTDLKRSASEEEFAGPPRTEMSQPMSTVQPTLDLSVELGLQPVTCSSACSLLKPVRRQLTSGKQIKDITATSAPHGPARGNRPN